MVNLPSMFNRCQELRERLRIHVLNLNESHPLGGKIQLAENKQCLLLRRILDPRPSGKAEIKEIKSFYKERSINENKSIMSSMIEMKPNAVDGCLGIKKTVIRRCAMRWRCSSKFLNGICKNNIHENVSRRCVKVCFRPYLRPKTKELYAEAYKRHNEDTYNILDHLLNNKKFKLFYKFYRKLNTPGDQSGEQLP